MVLAMGAAAWAEKPNGDALRPIQEDRCFYCAEPLRLATAVDHFVPWSRYPKDSALNFVLAHTNCNANKRELLAAIPHLDRWLERNRRQGDHILASLERVGFLPDSSISSMIARWAYGQAVSQGGHAWLRGQVTEPITREYLAVF